MREIVLSDAPQHLRPNAFLELTAYAAYPEDKASIEQAVALLAHERARWSRQCEGSVYRPSGLALAVVESLKKTTGQRYICGLVALAMSALDNAGRTPSLEKAAEIVSEYTNYADKARFVFWRADGWTEKDIRLLGDFATIKRAFRQYRAVAHILAADIVSTEHLSLMHPFERSPEADACYFATVLYYQHRLRKVPNIDSWNLWEVRISPPYDPADFPPLLPSDDTLYGLLDPWLAKGGH